MPVAVGSVTWIVHKRASADITAVRTELGEDEYFAGVASMQEWLCEYFDAAECKTKAASISPMGTNSNGGKILKARWMLPGGGKSGGLRVCLVAYCAERKVVVCRMFLRKEDPSPNDVSAAAELATDYDDE